MRGGSQGQRGVGARGDLAADLAADLTRQLEAAHVQLRAMAAREEERRSAAAEERKQQVIRLWLSFDQQACNHATLQSCNPACCNPACCVLRAACGVLRAACGVRRATLE